MDCEQLIIKIISLLHKVSFLINIQGDPFESVTFAAAREQSL